MGLNLWLTCTAESRQTTHAGSWWSRQKSLRFSECTVQSVWEPLEALCSVFCKYASHRFFKARLRGGLLCKDIILQTGHCFIGLSSHHLCRQALQKLWLHDKITGSSKMSWQMGQERWSSDCVVIFSLKDALSRADTQIKKILKFLYPPNLFPPSMTSTNILVLTASGALFCSSFPEQTS